MRIGKRLRSPQKRSALAAQRSSANRHWPQLAFQHYSRDLARIMLSPGPQMLYLGNGEAEEIARTGNQKRSNRGPAQLGPKMAAILVEERAVAMRDQLVMMTSEQAIGRLASSRHHWHARIAALRTEHLTGAKELSQRTKEQYAADAQRVAKAGSVGALAGCSSSFYKLRAAATWKAKEELRELMNRADRIRKAKGDQLQNEIEQLCLYEDGDKHTQGVEAIVSRLEKLQAEKWATAKVTAPTKATSRNQRQKLGRLADDWIPRIFEQMSRGKGAAEGKYKAACALSIVIGLRPEEIARGVTFTALPNGSLAFIVHGAKVVEADAAALKALASESKAKKEKRKETKEEEGKRRVQASAAVAKGQPERSLVVSAVPADKQAAFDYLKSLATQKSAVKIGSRITASNYCSAFSSASRKAFPKMKSPPSVYTLRHRFSADMKTAGMGAQDIAKAMGHSAEVSQENYGLRQQGKGGLEVGKITATNQVRSRKKGPPPSIFRQVPKPTGFDT